MNEKALCVSASPRANIRSGNQFNPPHNFPQGRGLRRGLRQHTPVRARRASLIGRYSGGTTFQAPVFVIKSDS